MPLRPMRLPRGKKRTRIAAAASRPPRQEELLARLKAAERSLRAIPAAGVDGLVVFGRRGAQVVTLKGGDSAYRMLVEAMSEGAATVSEKGAVLYCNRRFAELAGVPAPKLLGAEIHTLLDEAERGRLTAFLRSARKQGAKGEFILRTAGGRTVPVHLSLSRLRGYRGQALGAVVTDLTEQRQRQEEEIKRTEGIHRLVLERELAAQESERKRIARELHDEAGQLLTSLLVALRSLEDARNLEGCKTLGKRMREITARAIGDLGRMARGLHPIALDDHDLDAAFRGYVADYSKTHKLAVHLAMERVDSSRLPPAVQIALYRILQETLTNVARHARARTVHIDFKHTARALEMTVTDDGRGFDLSVASVGSSHHLGLQSIRERAALLGGKATFTSGKRGTAVQVQIPLTAWQFPALVRRAGA